MSIVVILLILDVDECANSACLGDSFCVNKIGTFSCLCNDGYEYKNDACQSKLLQIQNFFIQKQKLINLKINLSD